MKTYLAEVTGVAMIGGTPTTTTFRFSTSGYTTSSSDSPANTHFDARILGPVSVGRQLFGSNRVSGRSETSYGVLKLANIDGALEDELFGLSYPSPYVFVGHPVRVYRGEETDPFSSFEQIFLGLCAGVRFDTDEVTFELRDNSNQLDVPLQTTVYLGNNSLPAGVEGVDDIKGKPKPWLSGTVINVTPVLVNTTKLIYQVNDGSVFSVAVYDAGAALTAGTPDYTSQSDMENNAPAAGSYRVWKSGGMFRINAAPVGDITADVQQGSSSASLESNIRRVVEKVVPSITSFTLLGPSTGSTSSGVYVDTPTNALDVLDALANSAGLWYYLDQAGTTFNAGYLETPLGETPIFTFDQVDIQSISQIIPADDTKGIPVLKVSMSHSKNYTVQSASTLAATVTADRKARLGTEFIVTESTVGADVAQYPSAPIMYVESLITDATDAASQAGRLKDLHKEPRQMLVAVLHEASDTLVLNDVVMVIWPRLGLSGGKNFRVIGIESGLDFDQTQLTLWG